MSGGDRPRKNPQRAVLVVLVLTLLVLFAIIVVQTIPGVRNAFSRFVGMFSSQAQVITANEFSFDVGRDRSFAYIGGTVAGAGSLGIQVFDAEGRETLRDSFRMSQPAISQAGDNAIAFDIGGNSIRVFNATEVIAAFEAAGSIVSASTNRNGWFCVVTQEGGGSRGTIRVYNSRGSEVYTVVLGSGYALSAKLSHDNNSLAILNLTPYGSRVTLYHGLDAGEPDYVFDFVDGLIIDIYYLPNGKILALSTNSLLLIDSSGAGTALFTFYGNRLGGYALNEEFIALHLYDYGLGYSGRLVTLSLDGTILGEINTRRDIISMSSCNHLLMILQSTGLSFFSKELEELPVPEDAVLAAGADQVLSAGENTALATNDHSVIVIRLSEEEN